MANSNEYMRVYMLNRYHSRRAEAIELLGGKCVECGTTEKLEVDHIDRALKTLELSKLWAISRERFFKELELCQLLCKLHHREKTNEELSVGHGGGVSGKRNCPCRLCKDKKNEYLRQWKRNKKLGR